MRSVFDAVVGRTEQQAPGFQVGLVGLGIVSRLFRQCGPLVPGQLSLQRRGDLLRHFGFHRKHILQRAVVGFGPEMVVARCINQLHVNADAVTRFLHTAFENVGDAELAPDLGQILRPASVALGRGARDHLQIADLGQPGQDFVLDAVGEKGVVLLGAEVFKWQDGDGFGRNRDDRRRRRGG